MTGEPGGAPVKAGRAAHRSGAGLFALVGILAALQARQRTGAGQHIDTSLVDAGVGAVGVGGHRVFLVASAFRARSDRRIG